MSPYGPVDDFASRHHVALLLLGIDALAGSIELLALEGSGGAARRAPDDVDHALVGIVALARTIDGAARADRPVLPGTDAAPWSTGRALR
jgi:hypothetical protein